MNKTTRTLITAAVVAVASTTSACSDIFSFDAEAPGRIADGDLNTISAIPGLVAGMEYDLTQAFGGVLQEVLLAGGELWHSGSYDFGTYPRGILLQTPEDWDGGYGTMQQARWVAEDGLRRISEILEPEQFNRSADVAQAYVHGGYANRLLGEVQCTGTVDGGPEVPNTEFFNRADSLFSRAIQVGGAAGRQEVVRAAYAGRASIRAWLGDWAGAVQDAQQVPADFVYNAVFSTAVGAISNDLVFETTSRKEFTVFSTDYEPFTDDPRVPWEIRLDNAGQVEVGQDGETPFYQQQKFDSQDSDIALASGAEMLVLRAEDALRNGNNIPGMVALLNEARAVYEMAPITRIPADQAEAWELLRRERYNTTWLEGRRLYDMRRWQALGGAAADPFAQGRDLCFPISFEEQRVNDNF